MEKDDLDILLTKQLKDYPLLKFILDECLCSALMSPRHCLLASGTNVIHMKRFCWQELNSFLAKFLKAGSKHAEL